MKRPKLRRRDPDARRRRREDYFRPMLAALVAGTFVIVVLSWGLLYVAGDARSAARTAVENTERLNRAEECARAIASLFRTATNRNGAIIYVVLGAVGRQSRSGGPDVDFGELASLPQLQPAPVDCRDRTVRIPESVRFRDLPSHELDAIEDEELRELLRTFRRPPGD